MDYFKEVDLFRQEKRERNYHKFFICMICSFIFDFNHHTRHEKFVCIFCEEENMVIRAEKRGFRTNYLTGYTMSWRNLINVEKRRLQASGEIKR